MLCPANRLFRVDADIRHVAPCAYFLLQMCRKSAKNLDRKRRHVERLKVNLKVKTKNLRTVLPGSALGGFT